MRKTHRCTKCGHGAVVHIPDLRMFVCEQYAPSSLSMADGQFEGYACRKCGFTEFYMKGGLGPKNVRGARELKAQE